MSKKENKKSLIINEKNIPVAGSLGLLSIGDIAFRKWREVKVQNNIFKKEYEEGQKEK